MDIEKNEVTDRLSRRSFLWSMALASVKVELGSHRVGFKSWGQAWSWGHSWGYELGSGLCYCIIVHPLQAMESAEHAGE